MGDERDEPDAEKPLPAHPAAGLELFDTMILDRPWWPSRAAMLAFIAVALVAAVMQSLVVFGVALVPLVVAIVLSARRAPLGGAPHTRLLVSQSEVRSGAITVVEREEIVEGALWPSTTHGRLVQLKRRGLRPPVDVAVASIEDGRALLETLGFAPPHAKATFLGRSRLVTNRARPWLLFTSFFVGVFALVALVPSLRSPLLVSAALIAVPLLLALSSLIVIWPSTVEIGADGLLVRWLGRRKTIRFAELESFTTHRRGIRFILRDGSSYDLVTDAQSTGFVRDAIAERLRTAMEAIDQPSLDVAPLEREGRPIGDWIAALRALARRAEGFRDVPLGENGLWRVIEDPHASASAKAGAAVALARSLDDEGKKRLRVVSEATVSPKLRLALDAALVDDDERLCAALEDLEEERGAR